jgi:hypothetical protein
VAGTDRSATLAAARALRAALASDPAHLPAAAAVLRDESAPAAIREAVAAILGSLPGEAGKRAVLEELRSGSLLGIERVGILALGISEVEDGSAFERDGQPHAVEITPGLTVFVSGPLEDPEARVEAALRLGAADSAEERLAAARVLHDSSKFPETRDAFLEGLGSEPDGEVAAEAASALAEWTREVPLGDEERAAVVDRLFDVVPDSEEVVRFRLTAPLSSTSLSPEEAQRLTALAAAPQEDARRFAIDVLGRQLDPRSPGGDSRLGILASAAVSDSSSEVREAAAFALGRVTGDPGAVEALVRALGQDPDWEVRAAAARSLGPSAGLETARAALAAAASSDPQAEVRAAAEESLSPGGR